MLPGGKMLFDDDGASFSPDGSLAVLNSGGAFFDTGFHLGDHMTMEVCFLIPVGASESGYVLAGYYGGRDENDYRAFVASGNCYLDAGHGRGHVHYNRGAWYVLRGPVGSEFELNGHGVYGGYDSGGDYGAAGLAMKVFADDPASPNQLAAIRYLSVFRSGTEDLLCSFWPHPAGGFYDVVSGRFVLPEVGSVEIVDWSSL